MKQWLEKDKNGKIWLVDELQRCMVYGVETAEPYVRAFGRKWVLCEEQVAALREITA